MTTQATGSTADTLTAVRVVSVIAKTALVLLAAVALVDPAVAHLDGKAAEARALGYTLASFAVPVLWLAWFRDRVAFPWVPDLLVTLTCFTDFLGNRLDLYDDVWWFDDWMHFMNVGLLAVAVALLTLPRTSSFWAVLERALAFGSTAAIAWEVAEYFAFIAGSDERRFAYTDTLWDLALGVLGAVVGAWWVHARWHRGGLAQTEPLVGAGATP